MFVIVFVKHMLGLKGTDYLYYIPSLQTIIYIYIYFKRNLWTYKMMLFR